MENDLENTSCGSLISINLKTPKTSKTSCLTKMVHLPCFFRFFLEDYTYIVKWGLVKINHETKDPYFARTGIQWKLRCIFCGSLFLVHQKKSLRTEGTKAKITPSPEQARIREVAEGWRFFDLTVRVGVRFNCKKNSKKPPAKPTVHGPLNLNI